MPKTTSAHKSLAKTGDVKRGLSRELSPFLKSDSRLGSAPRHVEVLPEQKKKEISVLIKIYAMLHTPGSELMTICLVHSKSGKEFELAFDEKYPISLRFRTQTDSERVSHAKEQIFRHGGVEALYKVVSHLFPEFDVS